MTWIKQKDKQMTLIITKKNKERQAYIIKGEPMFIGSWILFITVEGERLAFSASDVSYVCGHEEVEK
jgi:hypothetical protein